MYIFIAREISSVAQEIWVAKTSETPIDRLEINCTTAINLAIYLLVAVHLSDTGFALSYLRYQFCRKNVFGGCMISIATHHAINHH